MVFFTCNHCGESLKKPAVEKHYTWKSCKGATPFLTCVDCLKDFRADEYREHTKCVSELERYSAKGFVGKPDKNKGAQKQEIWCDVIQQLQTKAGIDATVRQALERLGSNTNVPRKKAKFLNYIKSSMRMNPHNAEKLWNVIEVGLSDYQKIVDDRKSSKRSDEPKENGGTATTATDINGKGKKRKPDETGEESSAVVAAKKSKKKKNSTSMSDESVAAASAAVVAPETNGKSKKSKKNKTVDPPEKRTNGTAVENGGNAEKSKKNKTCKDVSSLVVPTIGFNWKATITKIVAKKKEINLEKLKSKVLKQYAAECNVDEITNKMERTFAKHLKRMKSFSIDNGIVKTVVG